MAKKKQEEAVEQEVQTPKTKEVKNRNNYKVELLVDGEVIVFKPHEVTRVPADFEVPTNIGLYVR